MHRFVFLFAISGCIAEDANPTMNNQPITPPLTNARLERVEWGGGLCRFSFDCAGQIGFRTNDEFMAHNPDNTLAAFGTLSAAAAQELAALVNAIPQSEKPGVLPPRGAFDGSEVAIRLNLPDEVQVYFSLGFRGVLGQRLTAIIDEIDACATGANIAAYGSACTPLQPPP